MFGNSIIENAHEPDLTGQPNPKMDGLSTENISDRKTNRKKRRGKSNKAVVKDEVQGLDQNNIDTRLTNSSAEQSVVMENLQSEDEGDSVAQTKMSTQPTEDSADGTVTRKKTKKRKRIVKSETEDGVQSKMDAEGNQTTKKPKIKEDIGSIENPAEGNVHIENPKTQDETQSTCPTNLDNGQAQGFAIGTVAGKRKARKKRKKKTNHVDEVQKEIDARSTHNHDEGNMTIQKPNVKDKLQCLGQIQLNASSTQNLAGGKTVVENLKTPDEGQSMDQNKVDACRVTENHAKGVVSGKRRNKRRRAKGKVNHDVHCELVTRSTVNLADGNAALGKPVTTDAGLNIAEIQRLTWSTEDLAGGKAIINNPKAQGQNMDQNKMDMRQPAENLAPGNITRKRRKKRKKIEEKVTNEVHSEMDSRSIENLGDGNEALEKPETKDASQSVVKTEMDIGSTAYVVEGNVTFEDLKSKDEGQSMDTVKMDAKDVTKEHVTGKRKKKRRRSKQAKNVGESLSMNCGGTMMNLQISEGLPNQLAAEKEMHVNGLSQVSNEIIMDEGIDNAEISTCNALDAAVLSLKGAPIASVRRKLIILDINGLLADIVYPAPKQCEADTRINGRAVFRRPFYDDFMKFCFQNFYVGIWSSRSKKIVDKVVSYLLGDQEKKLLFCWDMTHSTETGFKTLENHHKPLVCKELRKIWEKDDPTWPWKMGDYNESNTLLLDDSPYKALLNPPHTAIFPHSYQYSDEKDNSLGCGGDLRVYLEGVVRCENVQKYVARHHFGQKPITKKHKSWNFYNRVLRKISAPVNDNTPSLVKA